MTAPDRIWIEADENPYYYEESDRDEAASPITEYVRADLVDELVQALEEAQDEIDRYICHEYPSDHPVHERYRARGFAANPARIALARYRGGITSA